jgi:LuxR family transcriptional regulator, positive regulator of biofilm formation
MKVMTSHTSKKGGVKSLDSRAVYITGRHRFQDELLAFYLKNEIGVQCSVSETPFNIDTRNIKRSDQSALILIECPDKDPERFLSEFKERDKNLTSDHLVALFNVNHGLGIEEKAVALGIKGIFYKEDPVESFKKGIEAIFGGELWVSREILSKYVMKIRSKHNADEQDRALLTSREIEILTMISTGTKNEEIAERLFISPNTVKTHIYNIFKKINVPNRLQAALWAAKNL